MIADTLQTLINVPYLSLTPEIAPDYDERTSLTSFRTVFQLISSLAVVVAAPAIVDAVIQGGGSQQQGFMLVGAIFGGIGVIPLLLIAHFIKETSTPQQVESMPLRDIMARAWENIPFRYTVGIHMLNWSAVDMVAVVFPYFLLYWVAKGDLLASVPIFGFRLSFESAFFGILMSVCILFVPFWLWVARKRNKREAYIYGMLFWVMVQFMIYTIQPGQVGYMLVIAALAGVGVSAAYVLPDSLFSDIIEWDELRTGRRQEGIYFGVRAFVRKTTGAFVIFLTLQILGWSGYVPPPESAVHVTQTDGVLHVIRLMVAPFGAIMLAGAIIFALLFPLTREKYTRIQSLLERRRNRAQSDV
jgi:GPH family glycoside/pentoside/hexuronide:cation symporter